jgi:alpha-L-rhamnosidase
MTESRDVRVIKGATRDLAGQQWMISASLREIGASIRCYLRLSSALLILAVGLFPANLLAFQSNAPIHLQCEALQEPLGIDITNPRLAWQLQDSRRGAGQTGYEIRVASSAESLMQDHADVWDSGRVNSDQSVNVPYNGPAVESRRRYYWQVRVWDSQGQPSLYSQPSWWPQARV